MSVYVNFDFFFFKQKTAYELRISDWSSDVCSSDLLGAWDRAASQLEVAAKLDATAVPMAQTYGHAIRGETIRRAVFAGETAPTIFGAPERQSVGVGKG